MHSGLQRVRLGTPQKHLGYFNLLPRSACAEINCVVSCNREKWRVTLSPSEVHSLPQLWFSEDLSSSYLCRVFVWCPSTMCLSFDTYPVRRLYAALLRFLHLSLVYRGLLSGVDVCWSSLDTHWPFMWLSVLLFQSESCPGLVTHLLVKMLPRSCVQFGYFFLRRLSSLSALSSMPFSGI